MSRSSTLFTIGYEKSTQPDVFDTLAAAGVQLLVDVRAVAASRRPGFSKRQLAAGLDERGIDYLHLRSLGTPADGRAAARAGRHAEMARIFEGQLATEGAKAELDELVSLIGSGRRICLLCFERHAEHCHRAIVARRVCERIGVEVEHLIAAPEL